MKKTLICIHVMPNEIEQLFRLMLLFRFSMAYIDKKVDDVTFRASLNLNPSLTDWEASKLKQDYFIKRFESCFEGIPNINQIVTDESLWGTTQQKRESIVLEYDQFIFCDTDISFPPKLLKYQLNVANMVEGAYVVSPSLAKWWDESWSVLTHKDFLDKDLGYAHSIEANEAALLQEITSLEIKQLTGFKFGCGMHTLYSKPFWDLIGIPEAFGGYGPEDTFSMAIATWLQQQGIPVKQYIMDGIYIAENIHRREPSFAGKIVSINKKKEFYDKALSVYNDEVKKFIENLLSKTNPND